MISMTLAGQAGGLVTSEGVDGLNLRCLFYTYLWNWMNDFADISHVILRVITGEGLIVSIVKIKNKKKKKTQSLSYSVICLLSE